MGKSLDKADIVADLDEVWSRLLEVGEEIAESKWSNATSCPGWSIKDNFAHVIGTELSLLGMATPNSDQIDRSIVKNPIGEMNQQWIESMRGWSKREVLDKLAWVAKERKAAIEKMDQEEFMKLGPSPVGEAPYARFMQIRIFDCYMHEQDIRQAASLDFYDQGGAAEVSLHESISGMGFVVGKKAKAEKGSVVRFRITGGQQSAFDVVVQEKATLDFNLTSEPTTTLEVGFIEFTRLIGGRKDGGADYESRIKVSGDLELGSRVVGSLNFLI